ncbi:UNVERIFIED_ORG: TonB C-terminal domain-containing protein [Shinella sp. XGS7]
MARKIQLNTAPEQVRELGRQNPGVAVLVVAVRSDGAVESVSFERSSGVPAVDEALRRIIQSQANYPAFPPLLARDYDVIEIRRSWQIDSAIRLQ